MLLLSCKIRAKTKSGSLKKGTGQKRRVNSMWAGEKKGDVEKDLQIDNRILGRRETEPGNVARP